MDHQGNQVHQENVDQLDHKVSQVQEDKMANLENKVKGDRMDLQEALVSQDLVDL